jgi:hypothetical protein
MVTFCYKSGGGVNQRKRVGMTYLPMIEVKNVNRCFRHLLNVKALAMLGIRKYKSSNKNK